MDFALTWPDWPVWWVLWNFKFFQILVHQFSRYRGFSSKFAHFKIFFRKKLIFRKYARFSKKKSYISQNLRISSSNWMCKLGPGIARQKYIFSWSSVINNSQILIIISSSEWRAIAILNELITQYSYFIYELRRRWTAVWRSSFH